MRKGRFSQPAAELAHGYSESVSLDWGLYRHDIAGSIAHAAALARAGIITANERRQIESELQEIIWSTIEFGFLEFSDSFSTHSSLMPQKKNPDMAELTRGKAGRLYGNLMSMLTTMKAPPSSYNRDIQEDKRALFDSVDTIKSALGVFAVMLPDLTVNRNRMEKAAVDPSLLATDLAEYLVHSITKSIPLDQIGVAEMKKFSPHFDDDVAKIFRCSRFACATPRDRRSVT
jgi:argininosuccinate lyase